MFPRTSVSHDRRKVGPVGVPERSNLLPHKENEKEEFKLPTSYESVSDIMVHKINNQRVDIEMSSTVAGLKHKHQPSHPTTTGGQNRTFVADDDLVSSSLQRSRDIDDFHNTSFDAVVGSSLVGDEALLLIEKEKAKSSSSNNEAKRLHQEFYADIDKASNIGLIESERRRRAILGKNNNNNDPFAGPTLARSVNVVPIQVNVPTLVKLGRGGYEKIPSRDPSIEVVSSQESSRGSNQVMGQGLVGREKLLLWQTPHSQPQSNSQQSHSSSLRKPSEA